MPRTSSRAATPSSLFTDDAAPLGRPYWWDGGAPLPELPPRPPERVDVLVVGAGYTGLSAALACADGGAEVAVLDAGRPGEGASTRNGGMVGAHPRLPYERLVAAFGTEVAHGLYREARPAFEHLQGLIVREGIDCGFAPTGRLQLAWTRADFAAQARLVAAVTAVSDMRMELVEREALGGEIATRRYFGAIHYPDHAALDPRRLHDGLLAAALRRGVTVVEGCAVERLRRARGGHVAETAAGKVAAAKVIVATNGYTRGRLGWFRRRVYALPSFLVATEPLDPRLLALLAPGRRMMVETRALHAYYRLSPDGSRILFGGRAAMVPIPPERAAARLRRALVDIWPELRGVRLTHSWSGLTGFSFAQMPSVGSHEGVHFAMGYSGSGVALAPYLGTKAGLQALGDPRGETAYARTTLRARPFHPGGRPLFLDLADLWFRHVVDPRQDAAARRDAAG